VVLHQRCQHVSLEMQACELRVQIYELGILKVVANPIFRYYSPKIVDFFFRLKNFH
jgi:hypothetical protein